MKTKNKIPMRQCTGCREMKNKKEMIRVLKTAEDEIILVQRAGIAAGGHFEIGVAPLAQHRQFQIQRWDAQDTNIVPAVHGFFRHLPLGIQQVFRQLYRRGI